MRWGLGMGKEAGQAAVVLMYHWLLPAGDAREF